MSRDLMTRRVFTRGAAWSVPVIALAAAAPQAAASTVDEVNWACVEEGDEHPNEWRVYGPGLPAQGEVWDNPTAMKHPIIGDICRSMGDNPGGGK